MRNKPARSHRVHAARTFVGLLVSMTLAACAVGPVHPRPDSDVPSQFAATQLPNSTGDTVPSALGSASEPIPAADATFWQRFGDPVLNELIDAALAENHDLRIALSRYDEANAL